MQDISEPTALTSPADIRLLARRNRFSRPTGGLAPGYLQANIVILPRAHAEDFEAYVEANRLACPLVGRGEPGDPSLPMLGADIDIRTDLPRYRVFRGGRRVGDPLSISELWQDDFVTFALGCSLSFEADLVAAGVDLRCHAAPGTSCSAFVSKIATAPAGPFHGPLVVSMRAVRRDQVELAQEVTAAHPEAHGPPVHVGDPAGIGVDLSHPIDDIGLTDIRDGEVPMFWACGVTPQYAIENAALPIAITHAPGHVLVTDRLVEPFSLARPTGSTRG